ncbi:hypothetical protein Aple_075660 [Acrocarpospora pleiomorpha]|uniref:CATRA-Associated Small Protein domain-containing protein n=2 Tax=Acrocarpospora pleiomorpha TaxID=90975 RepID=A0A5M3XTU6_9ACTN|nr:CATRA system-associated protein [Acrocarpospora pleiomorpha]GES24667.1 hypothetical protein Aple_075660 [Acrocarpospora pleiomorpha]
MIQAESTDGQYSDTRDLSFFEEIMVSFVLKRWLSKFKEKISISVTDDGWVHVESVSQPSTVIIDQGRNVGNVIKIWRKLDEYLLNSRGVVIDSSVTITGNTGSVQNASPHAQQQNNSPASRQTIHMGEHLDEQEMAADTLAILSDLLLWRTSLKRWGRIEQILAHMQAAFADSNMTTAWSAVADLALAGTTRNTRIGDTPTVPPPAAVRDRVSQMIHSLDGDMERSSGDPGVG